MKTSCLLPHKYKIIGWFLLILGLIAGCVFFFGDYDTNALTISVISIYNDTGIFGGEEGFLKIIENSIVDELIALSIIIGGLLVGFSREKLEDEFIYKLRKDSLFWAIIFNYIVLIFTVIFIYDFTFFDVLVFNMFTPLLFFIIRFNFLRLRSTRYEE
ncbi:MAG: hypothetical protein ACI83H_000109 [Glaciecola sp.]|jgi:hypothetical protein